MQARRQLKRVLATTAEHAADEAAMEITGESRQYAEVLLDMAEAVRQAGGRLARHGVGVDGSGLLGERIDRILRRRMYGAISRKRKLAVAVACAVTILVVVAWRQAQPIAAPLKPSADVAQQIAKSKTTQQLRRHAVQLTAAQAAAIEESLGKNPDDLAALQELQFFYVWRAEKVFGRDEMVRRRLRHVLSVIDRHPDIDTDVWPISASADPAGYAEAKQHWLVQTDKPTASARTLSNAARFFREDEPALAEKLLVRARTLDSTARTAQTGLLAASPWPSYWSRHLGVFYGDVLADQ